MIQLDLQETREALPFDKLVPTIDAAFRKPSTIPLRHHHTLPAKDEADATLLLMPAWFDDGFGGVKIAHIVPGNRQRGKPSVSSTYVLFDRQTGEHLMMLDGGELTARRTAATSALAAKRLAREDCKRLLVVGAGRVASNLPYAYRAALQIDEVAVYNRTAASATALVGTLKQDGFTAIHETDLRDAVSQADIVSCATLAVDPIIAGSWLKPGQHLDLIGGFTPAMRETDNDAILRSSVFVDTEHALVEAGDIAQPLADGTITEKDIRGTLMALCRQDACGRERRDEITLFKSVGSAVEDLAAATLAYKTLG